MSSIIINNYYFDKPLTSDNSGFSKWGIGRRNGKYYFVKEFLSPVYPVDDSMFSEQKRKEKIALCDAFVKEKQKMYSAINEVTDGNLVGIEQFFRVGAKFYISTLAIPKPFLSVGEICDFPFYERLMLCAAVAHAIAGLHSKNIVHADIKPDNVLVRRGKHPEAKIIDFDCSFFFFFSPKPGEELNGDMVYLSPEAFLHIIGEESNLSCKMDVFALGLLFHQYMCGFLPYFDTDEYQYAYESVLDDKPLSVYPRMNTTVADLLTKMLNKDPAARPKMSAVFNCLHSLLLRVMNRDPAAAQPDRQTPPTPVREVRQNSDNPFFNHGGDLI